MQGSPNKILVASLDWGLGHATRCIPLIRELLKRNCEVQIASSGSALILLVEEFPSLKFHELISYKARYSSLFPFMMKILMQVPKLLLTIKREHRQIEKIVAEERIEIIISDNRYGCWSSKTKNIFICHQLNLTVPFFSRLINNLHERAIRKFSICWIPDDSEFSLSGILSNNKNIPSARIGLLSRMKWYQTEITYDLLVIISGPEPHRTSFEKLIISEIKKVEGKIFVVRGLPGAVLSDVDALESTSHLSAEKMNELMLHSQLILSRPGYSTLMDLATLGKKAIFVPTPDQPEQEYLANEMMKIKIAFAVSQDKFNLREAIESSRNYSGFNRCEVNSELGKVVDDLLNEINQKF